MIDRSRLRNGQGLHARNQKSQSVGVKIRKVLTVGMNRRGVVGECQGNHDAIMGFVKGQWCVGDAQCLLCRWTPLRLWEHWVWTGQHHVWFYEPLGYTRELGDAAVDYWCRHFNHHPYDVWAYPRLIEKELFQEWAALDPDEAPARQGIGAQKAGKEWAGWCTETYGDSWRKGAGLDVYGNPNATPLTAEFRLGWHEKPGNQVLLREITRDLVLPGFRVMFGGRFVS